MESMQTDDEKKADMFIWDDSSTRLLLSFYKDALKDLGKTSHLRTKNQLWVQVVEELSKYGYIIGPKQAQNRLVTLERSFKKRQGDSNRKHQNATSILFDDEIREIMENKKNTSFGINMAELSYENSTSFDMELADDGSGSRDFTSSSDMSLKPFELNRWDPDSSKLFINIYHKTVTNPTKMRSFKTKKKLWQFIADKVNLHGYEFTGRQARNRFSTLIRAYKKCLEKKRSGVRSYFMFEAEVREILQHKVVMPNPGDVDSDGYDEDEDEDDDDDVGENVEFDLNFVNVDENNIDNISMPLESEASSSTLPQSFTVSSKLKTKLPQSSPGPFPRTESYAILNELRLLRRAESESRQKMFKIEEEKLDLMRQNNILLKVLIEKLSNKS